VRDGVLSAQPGRGPGSGVRATPETLALLFIAILASAMNLADAGPLTRALAEATPTPTKKCPLTGATNLKDAVAQILANRSLLAKVDTIRGTGLAGTAEIIYRENRQNKTSQFAGRASEKPGVRFTVSIPLGMRFAIEVSEASK